MGFNEKSPKSSTKDLFVYPPKNLSIVYVNLLVCVHKIFQMESEEKNTEKLYVYTKFNKSGCPYYVM